MLGINIPEDETTNWKLEMDNGELSLIKKKRRVYYEGFFFRTFYS